MFIVVKLKRDKLKLVAEEIGLTVQRDAKMICLKRLIEESDVFKEDYEFVKTVIEQVLEESKTQKSKQSSQIELERLKLERVKVELKLAKLKKGIAQFIARSLLMDVTLKCLLMKTWSYLKEPRKFFLLKVNEATYLEWFQMLWYNLSLLWEKEFT
ncbi:hypothetical protein TNCV_4807791 [Trichonephila clavipes]|nr:hypothetical protein TNCV_4807791 [Trichonephila clavipes]